MKIESKKGFYVGDVAFALADETYRTYAGNWRDLDFDEGDPFEPGIGFPFPTCDVMDSGTFIDNERNEYVAESGLTGLVPLEQVEKDDLLELGTVFMIPGEAVMACAFYQCDILLPDRRIISVRMRKEKR